MISKLRGIWRFIVFIFLCNWHILLAYLRSFYADKSDPNYAYDLVQLWARRAKRALNIKIDIQGKVPEDGVLLVPNHRSYIDPVPLIVCVKSCFVAKKEVNSWPVIKLGARIARTIFVDRKDKASRKQTRLAVRERLEEGISTVVFPEGTTYRSPTLGRLHTGIFQTAVEGQFPIVPAAIEFADPDDAWIDKDLFVWHFLECFRKKETYVKLRFGPVIEGDDSAELVEQVRIWLEKNLQELREEFVQEGYSEMEKVVQQLQSN